MTPIPTPSHKPLIPLPDDPRVGIWFVLCVIIVIALLALRVRGRIRRGDFD